MYKPDRRWEGPGRGASFEWLLGFGPRNRLQAGRLVARPAVLSRRRAGHRRLRFLSFNGLSCVEGSPRASPLEKQDEQSQDGKAKLGDRWFTEDFRKSDEMQKRPDDPNHRYRGHHLATNSAMTVFSSVDLGRDPLSRRRSPLEDRRTSSFVTAWRRSQAGR